MRGFGGKRCASNSNLSARSASSVYATKLARDSVCILMIQNGLVARVRDAGIWRMVLLAAKQLECA